MGEQVEEKKVGIPESIVLGGVTYLVKEHPALQQFIQEVAKVEKSKLYTQYENLKSQIANLQKVEVLGEEKAFDVDTIVEKLKGTFVTKEDFKEALPNVLKEVVQPMLTATEQQQKDELARYREKLIQDNIATCIPDLVKGETKEELDAALKESIRIRSSYPTPSTAAIEHKPVVDPLIEKQQKELEAAISPTPAAPQAPVVAPPLAPRRPSPEASGAQNVKQMTMGEFAKQREAIHEQLQAMYGG